jgi:hypothetical protein
MVLRQWLNSSWEWLAAVAEASTCSRDSESGVSTIQ